MYNLAIASCLQNKLDCFGIKHATINWGYVYLCDNPYLNVI